MNKLFSIILLVMATGLLGACSSDSGAGNTETNLNDLSTAVVAVKSNIAKVAVFSSTSSSSIKTRDANDWTDTVLTDLGGQNCSDTDTPKGLLEEMTNSNCTVSPVFDLNNMLDMMCVITNELPITDGLPDAGTHAIVISSATGTSCGVADAVGFELNATVANTATQTTYQRSITFTANGDRSILVGATGNATNIAFTYEEDDSSSAYRGYYTSDSTTGITKFELQSKSTQGTSNFTLFRVFMDESESPGEIIAVGTRNDQGNAGLFTRWTFAAPLDASDDYGVAMAFGGHGAGGTSPLETCIDPSSNFSASGVTANNCGDDNFTAPGVNDFSTLAAGVFNTIDAMTIQQFVDGLDDTDILSWDDTDINQEGVL